MTGFGAGVTGFGAGLGAGMTGYSDLIFGRTVVCCPITIQPVTAIPTSNTMNIASIVLNSHSL